MDSNPRSPRKRDIDFQNSPVRHNLPASARGTEGSNPCTLQGGYWLVGIVDWPNRAGLPGVARESCVLRAPGTDLHPGRSAATEVPWEVALRAPVQGLTLVAAARM